MTGKFPSTILMQLQFRYTCGYCVPKMSLRCTFQRHHEDHTSYAQLAHVVLYVFFCHIYHAQELYQKLQCKNVTYIQPNLVTFQIFMYKGKSQNLLLKSDYSMVGQCSHQSHPTTCGHSSKSPCYCLRFFSYA